jgi:prepilin peptidase CpaA
VLANLHFMLTTTVLQAQAGHCPTVDAPVQPTGRLPYAVAIAAGTVIEALHQWTSV